MIVTVYEYEKVSNAPYRYKVCIKTDKSNTVFQTNYYSELRFFYQKYEINFLACSRRSTRRHKNYYGELECTQTIHYIKEGEYI